MSKVHKKSSRKVTPIVEPPIMQPEQDITKIIGEADVEAKFLADMIQEFVLYHNELNNKDGAPLFTGVNSKDKSSTNYPMEEYYEAMFMFQHYEKTNKTYTMVYPVAEFKISDQAVDLYGIAKRSKLHLVSPSLFAILMEIVNLKREALEKGKNPNNYRIMPIRR